VHPNQLAYCNDAFTPKPTEIAYAYEVIEALEQAHREGRGTIMLNGRLVEHHHVSAAKRILALAEMIKELESA
jgi:citrate lyase subunit beta / citryl-CoA lyase